MDDFGEFKPVGPAGLRGNFRFTGAGPLDVFLARIAQKEPVDEVYADGTKVGEGEGGGVDGEVLVRVELQRAHMWGGLAGAASDGTAFGVDAGDVNTVLGRQPASLDQTDDGGHEDLPNAEPNIEWVVDGYVRRREDLGDEHRLRVPIKESRRCGLTRYEVIEPHLRDVGDGPTLVHRGQQSVIGNSLLRRS